MATPCKRCCPAQPHLPLNHFQMSGNASSGIEWFLEKLQLFFYSPPIFHHPIPDIQMKIHLTYILCSILPPLDEYEKNNSLHELSRNWLHLIYDQSPVEEEEEEIFGSQTKSCLMGAHQAAV